MDAGVLGDSMVGRDYGQLVSGTATFTDDVHHDGQVYMGVVRSRYAHARLLDVDTRRAEAHGGVRAIFTAADVARSGVPGEVPLRTALPDPDGVRIRSPLVAPRRPLLAEDRVRYVGEPIAVVLADSRYDAKDAVDLVDVDYDPLPPITHPGEAISGDAPTLYESAPENVAFDWSCGDEAATDGAFDDAPHTVSVTLEHQRVIPNAIEPRAAVASFDPDEEALVMWRPSQGPHTHKRSLADILGLSAESIRVITPAVGGSFGNKSKLYPAECLVAWCAFYTGMPVKWQATRSEMYQSGAHGRGHETSGELAFDESGEFLAIRATSHADIGAYVIGPAATIHTSSFASVLSGQYTIPDLYCRVIGCFTSTAPVSSYRATSRPQTVLLVERLVERAARRLDVDPVELRRRNFIRPEQFPYDTPLLASYDSGDYERTLDRATEMVDYEDRREEQRSLREDGRYLGIGIACSLDEAGSNAPEYCSITVETSGEVVARCGSLDSGQAHRTTFAQLLGAEFEVPVEEVRIEQGDTATIADGTGTFGSRTAIVTERMFETCADELRDRGRRIAAETLEADPADVRYADGDFFVRGASDRAVDLGEVARLAAERDDGDLIASTTETDVSTFPFGTHVAVVEVTPESGEVELLRYVAVDDCGTQINPAVVDGQIVGGTVQGIGQALFESARYDENGTLLTGSMQDYAVPRAHQLPDIEVDTTTTPSPRTKHGIKGVAESGPAAAPAAVSNAVMDALAPFDPDEIPLHVTPERVWRAIRGA